MLLNRCKPSNLKLLSTTASTAPKVKKNINSVIEQLEKDQNDFKKNYLMDAGAYPVAGILAFACVFCAVFMGRTLVVSHDVRMSPSKRQAIIREHREP